MSVEQAPVSGPRDPERRFLLEDVPWDTYVAMRDALDRPGLRMTYLEGRLELMTTSGRHEEEKTIIARLLETWADELDVDLRGFGQTTFREEAVKRGLEPDECYFVGAPGPGEVPHIAVEVVVSNPLLDKLAVYSGLGVREVWVWHSESRLLAVHHLVDGQYEEVEQSRMVPGVDLELLVSFVKAGESQTQLCKAYRAALASR